MNKVFEYFRVSPFYKSALPMHSDINTNINLEKIVIDECENKTIKPEIRDTLRDEHWKMIPCISILSKY